MRCDFHAQRQQQEPGQQPERGEQHPGCGGGGAARGWLASLLGEDNLSAGGIRPWVLRAYIAAMCWHVCDAALGLMPS